MALLHELSNSPQVTPFRGASSVPAHGTEAHDIIQVPIDQETASDALDIADCFVDEVLKYGDDTLFADDGIDAVSESAMLAAAGGPMVHEVDDHEATGLALEHGRPPPPLATALASGLSPPSLGGPRLSVDTGGPRTLPLSTIDGVVLPVAAAAGTNSTPTRAPCFIDDTASIESVDTVDPSSLMDHLDISAVPAVTENIMRNREVALPASSVPLLSMVVGRDVRYLMFDPRTGTTSWVDGCMVSDADKAFVRSALLLPGWYGVISRLAPGCNSPTSQQATL